MCEYVPAFPGSHGESRYVTDIQEWLPPPPHTCCFSLMTQPRMHGTKTHARVHSETLDIYEAPPPAQELMANYQGDVVMDLLNMEAA